MYQLYFNAFFVSNYFLSHWDLYCFFRVLCKALVSNLYFQMNKKPVVESFDWVLIFLIADGILIKISFKTSRQYHG